MSSETVIVWATDKGGFEYRGIRWSVTLKIVVLENGDQVAGSWMDARILMDSIVDNIEATQSISAAPSATVHGPVNEYDQRPPHEQAAPPRQQTAGGWVQRDVAKQGDRVGEHAFRIAKLVTEDGESVKYRLDYKAGPNVSKFPIVIAKLSDIELLEKALYAAGFDTKNWKLGKPEDLIIDVSWVVGPPMKDNNPNDKPKHYRDFDKDSFVILSNGVPF